ncbi:CheA signal transduction histidine kinase [Chthoniobacter flavus Ellin428]|uniref:histidine kinase n=1 Tax=Chthoniobacter flavus Ellin428 TaxID=497964 RepID=B4D1M9_9BACT|nr:hybrid sensor histidine kinase/response regulator [Chthoniobacter flavus]EDY19641.1 CheA signal transduction histidine kinase [Chthoniobacter flavus Ellin428]TCO92878.1 two-component system sensor histidine kinase and response regulator WspE [Chthoniobacter flavus]
MSTSSIPDLSGISMAELFRIEAEAQTQTLTAGLLALERDPADAAHLESLMRAAHSIKGAARIVGINAAVNVAHAMEDCFVAAQKGALTLGQAEIDILLEGVDLLSRIANSSEAEMAKWEGAAEIESFLARLANPANASNAVATAAPAASAPARSADPTTANADRVLRVTADHLNRLLGLAGESLVEARWLDPFARSLLRLKRMQQEFGKCTEELRNALAGTPLSEDAQMRLAALEKKGAECRDFLGARLVELEMFDRRSGNLSHRLYDEALALRMRPFIDSAQNFPRLVRDIGRSLGKEVRLEIVGEQTQVDRDILEKLEAPLNHLLRNAVDHGIDFPEERLAAGKPREGTVWLEARHSAGMLLITVRDDGRGIDVESVRGAVVARKLTNEETAAKMSDAELLEFLFLPGFTMKTEVTEVSGRGVGLDVVQVTMKQLRGTLRTTSELGRGTAIQLQLPLTLSVLRALVVEIAGEPYGIPLAAITRTLKLGKGKVEMLEGRPHFAFDGQRIGLVTARQVFEKGESPLSGDELPVVIIGDRGNRYGLVLDRFLGERELVVQPLDSRLGKVPNISAGALADDGAPLLIADVEDMLRSIEKLSASGRLENVQRSSAGAQPARRKRVLVVDDSLTVRELERKLLEGHGYAVEIAVDGMDGWNAVRTGDHDLVITDVDMPRMDGIELVSLIRKDPNLKSKPIMIVSYKDREEDRARGLEAGADYYLTKGSFHDESLISSVADLIGES